MADPDKKIARPRQIYTGEDARELVPMTLRGHELVGV